MKARFTAKFTKVLGSGAGRATRTFKGTITVKEEGEHFVTAVIGAVHGIYKEEDMEGISRIDLTTSIIQPRRK